MHTACLNFYCFYINNYTPRALYRNPTGTQSGTMLLHHPLTDAENYEQVDKNLRNICCNNNHGFCERFLRQRVINKCRNYEGPSVCKYYIAIMYYVISFD